MPKLTYGAEMLQVLGAIFDKMDEDGDGEVTASKYLLLIDWSSHSEWYSVWHLNGAKSSHYKKGNIQQKHHHEAASIEFIQNKSYS